MAELEKKYSAKQKEYREKHREKRNQQKRDWYKQNREWCLEYAKEYVKQNEQARKDYMKKWASENWEKILERKLKKYPEKYEARRITNNKLGKIPQGTICEICNQNSAVHKHHLDYTNPLVIKFVCRKCHNKLHGKN